MRPAVGLLLFYKEKSEENENMKNYKIAVAGTGYVGLSLVAITLAICSIAYEVIIRIAPWMVGKRHNKAKKMSICG